MIHLTPFYSKASQTNITVCVFCAVESEVELPQLKCPREHRYHCRFIWFAIPGERCFATKMAKGAWERDRPPLKGVLTQLGR